MCYWINVTQLLDEQASPSSQEPPERSVVAPWQISKFRKRLINESAVNEMKWLLMPGSFTALDLQRVVKNRAAIWARRCVRRAKVENAKGWSEEPPRFDPWSRYVQLRTHGYSEVCTRGRIICTRGAAGDHLQRGLHEG